MRLGLKDGLKDAALTGAGLVSRSESARRGAFNALRLRQPGMSELLERADLRFLASAFHRRSWSKAQILQDLWVLFELDDLHGGYIVEFGATNGLDNSNTWLLEKRFGWTGILAEPNPAWHEGLKANRGCHIDARCVYATTGQQLTFLAADDPELSGLATSSGHDHNAERRAAGEAFDVATVSLNDLLAAHGAPGRIDYMSVDTEGSEFEILERFDFDSYQVQLFSIEHNHTDNEQRIDRLMLDRGYERRFPEFSQWDGWYVRKPAN